MRLSGGIDLQSQKALWSNGSSDNLDQFFGRINLYAKYSDEFLSSVIQIRAYPAGFGYEPLFGIELAEEDSAIVEKAEQIAKFQVAQGWVRYAFKPVTVTVGRKGTEISRSANMGNYLVNDNGAGFRSKDVVHNMLELAKQTGPIHSSVIFGAVDRHLNQGYLRIREVITPLERLHIGLGYRGNIFDKVYDRDARVLHRQNIDLAYTVRAGLTGYAEIGIFKANGDTTYQVPVLLGTTIPTAGLLDQIYLEGEYAAERENPVSFNVSAVKKLGTRVKVIGALFTDPAGDNNGDVRFAIRFSTSLN